MNSPHLKNLITLIQKENRTRTPELLIAFDSDGYSLELEWCISNSFQPALDIFQTPVTVEAQTTHKLTQGSNFNFKKSDVLYRHKTGYTESNYSGQAVQIIEGMPAIAATKTQTRDPGAVAYGLFTVSKGLFISEGKDNMTQDQFVRFLITSQLPKDYEHDKNLHSEELSIHPK